MAEAPLRSRPAMTSDMNRSRGAHTPLANKAALAIMNGEHGRPSTPSATGNFLAGIISKSTNVDGLYSALSAALPILGMALSEMREKHGDANAEVAQLKLYYHNAEDALKEARNGVA